MKNLSKIQSELLDILRNRDENFTLEKIAGILGLSNKSSVHYHVKELLKKGFLKVNPSNSSDYIVLDKSDNGLFYIPLFSSAYCSPQGDLVSDHETKEIPIPSRILNFDVESAIAIQTKNDSMIPKIPENSVILVDTEENIYEENKTFLVSSEDGGVIVKNLSLDKKRKMYILSSFNPNYHPFTVEPNDLRIIGKVKAIISNFNQ